MRGSSNDQACLTNADSPTVRLRYRRRWLTFARGRCPHRLNQESVGISGSHPLARASRDAAESWFGCRRASAPYWDPVLRRSIRTKRQ